MAEVTEHIVQGAMVNKWKDDSFGWIVSIAIVLGPILILIGAIFHMAKR